MRAVILDVHEHGEADRMYTLLTDTHGVIVARAQSVRLEKSKLRGALQPYAVLRIGCIHGNQWKITDVVCEVGGTLPLPVQQLLGRVGALVHRLVSDDEPIEDVFAVYAEGLRYVHTNALGTHECAALETVLVIRVLERLGYFRGGGYYEHIIASPYITDIILTEAMRLTTRLIPQINRSMREIQL